MRNIHIIIEYDGTNYCGWQTQKDRPSIEQKISEAIEIVTKEKSEVIGSGRTDAGVHALGQSANFLTNTSIPIERIPLALNTKLPKDIRVKKAYERDINFHSRHCAKRRVYNYKIINNLTGTALAWNKLYHVRDSLDLDKMKKASQYLIGTHDFTSFCSAQCTSPSKVRTMYDISIEKHDDIIDIYVEGSGFLYNMVRIIAGTLIDVGKGKIDCLKISEILEGRDRSLAGPTAPAHGLYLKKVIY